MASAIYRKHIFFLFLGTLLIIASSCEKEPFWTKGTNPKIIPSVKSVNTKASDGSMPGKFISERIVSSADGFDLIETVYENETTVSDGSSATKGSIVTNANINAFNMMVYAEDEWFDHTIKDGDPGSKTNKNAAGLYFEAASTRSGGTWGLSKTDGPAREGTGDEAGNLYWVNNVPLTFWSYNIVKPSRTGTHTASFSYTVKSNVGQQEDLIYAFSKENRAFFDQGEDDYGEMDASGCSSTSGASDEYVNIWFYHALSAVQFLEHEDLDGYRISNIEIQNVDSQTSCVMTSTDSTPAASSPNITFAHTSSTPASFSQSYDVDDTSLDIPSTSDKFKPGDSKTFIMVPQTLSTDSRFKVTFTNTTTAGSGKTTSPVFDVDGSWEPGKYYIYRIDLSGAVKVEISENCTTTTKSDVKFKNTSSINEYIRAAVIGNWYDASGNIVAPWTGSITPGSGWTASNGFYYHDSPVKTGEFTNTLISSFTKPATAPVDGAHFEMTILVQAVASDEYSSCTAAFN